MHKPACRRTLIRAPDASESELYANAIYLQNIASAVKAAEALSTSHIDSPTPSKLEAISTPLYDARK
jgi:hypothetical protein